MTTRTVFLALLALIVAICLAQPPIPARYDGWKLGRSNAPLLMEIYVDLACIDTRPWWLEIFPQLYGYYFNSSVAAGPVAASNQSAPGDLLFILHQYPLPYHISAFDLAMASQMIQRYAPSCYQKFVTSIFVHQDKHSNEALLDVTRRNYLSFLYDSFVAPCNISLQLFNEVMYSYEWWDRTRTAFKYGSTRSVFGTPSFFVNGVQLYGADQMSFADWKKLFDQLKEAS